MSNQRPNVNYGNRDAALAGEILRTVVGSGVHGIAIAGTDDHDEMGVYVEPREHVYGARSPLDHHIWRTQPEGARSGPGDVDLVMYSLRKYLRLAVKGNPTALLPLFAPAESVLVTTAAGERLRANSSAFLSQQAVGRFLGYLHSQHRRMLGLAGRAPNRPELVATYGWDTKYGSHALRLAYQGAEICHRARLSLPLPGEQRSRVLAVKRGEVPREEVSAEITEIAAGIRAALDAGTTAVPPTADLDSISQLSIELHEWFWTGGDQDLPSSQTTT